MKATGNKRNESSSKSKYEQDQKKAERWCGDDTEVVVVPVTDRVMRRPSRIVPMLMFVSPARVAATEKISTREARILET